MNDAEREALLNAWKQPPSDTEDQRAENACRIVSNAVRGSQKLLKWNITVFVQGSYKNNTNVRRDSDVDICVCLSDTITTDYQSAPGRSDETEGVTHPPRYPYGQFKNDLHIALVSSFGATNVARGNKAFQISENTYRVTADVVACLEHRKYNIYGGYETGTSLHPDAGGGWIYNFPAQHYANAVTKNKRTGGFFKDTVRILKNLRNRMHAQGIAQAAPLPSFFNECLVWNTPDHHLLSSTWNETIRTTLLHLWQHLDSPGSCGHWNQVNELIPLFFGAYTREQARDWVSAAWQWLEFE